MSSRSPGPARTCRPPAHSSASTTIIITSSAGSLTPTLCSSPGKRKDDVVRLESDNDDETPTKRVKIAFRPPMKEPFDAAGSGVQAEKIQPQNRDGEASQPAEGTGHPQVHTTDEKQTTILDKFRDLRSWNLFERYYQPSPVGPDYGTPDEHSVRIIIPTSGSDMVKPGGPARPTFTYGKNNKSVSTGASKPYRHISPIKPFDLTSPYLSLSGDIDAEHVRKKQKTGTTMPGISDTDDELLYEATRNQTASSRPQKSVSSNIPLLERMDPRHQHGISEFMSVENTISGKGRRRGEQFTRTPSNDTSRASTVVIDDDNEEIQDSGPEISKPQPQSYLGSANRAPPRTKDGRMAHGALRRQTGARSEHFDSYPNAVTVSNGITRRTSIKKRDAARAIQNQRGSDETDEISEDEHIKYKPNTKHKKTIFGMCRKSPDSASMSRYGDIVPSLPRQTQRTAKGKARASKAEEYPIFPVKYLRTSSGPYHHEKGDEPWYYQYNPGTHQMDIVAEKKNISDMETSFAFKPGSVNKVYYSDEDSRVVLFTPLNTTQPGSEKLLIELNNDVGGRFIQHLQKVGAGCCNPPVERAYLQKAFDRFNVELDRMKLPARKGKVSGEDIGLLNQNRIRKWAQVGEFDSTRSNTKAENFDRSMEAPKTQKLHQKIRKQSPDSGPTKLPGSDGEEQPKKSQLQRIKNDNNDASQSTRSTRSSQYREVRKESPSPPLRWTDQDRNWEKYWKGDEPLTFPFEGKKQTPVDKRDIERLDEGEFLNDNLISFYLRYLEEKTARERPDIAKRVFFMSSFFYQRLTRGKGRKNIDYEAVKRWTSKVNIFEFDYIVVPVNENAHWYVAIICNAPKLLQPSEAQKEEQAQVDEKDVVDLEELTDGAVAAKPSIKTDGSKSPDVASKVGSMSIDDDSGHNSEWPTDIIDNGTHNQASFGKNQLTIPRDKDQPQAISPSPAKTKKGKKKSFPPVRRYNTEEPRIITLDSLGLSHSPTCSNLREFLICEAKEKLGVEISLIQTSIGMTAKNIPQQNNYCDCGLFLLGYVEGFLDNPDDTIHSIMQGKPDLGKHFPKMDATQMRINMRDLIFKLRTEQIKKEHENKIAKDLAKKAAKAEAKANEATKSQPQSQTTEASTAPTSPESVATSRPGLEFLAEPAPTSKAKKVPEEPEVCEINVSAPAEAKEEVSAVPSPSTDGDMFINAIDELSQFGRPRGKPDIPQPNASMQLEDVPETAGRRAILDKTPTRREPASSSRSPRPSLRVGITPKGPKQKHPSPKPLSAPKPSVDEEVSSSPETMQVDSPSSSGRDSLLDDMSPAKDVHEIPDSQTEEEQQRGSGADGFEDLLAAEHRPLGIASPPRKPARARTASSPILPPASRPFGRRTGASGVFRGSGSSPGLGQERRRNGGERRRGGEEKRRAETPILVE